MPSTHPPWSNCGKNGKNQNVNNGILFRLRALYLCLSCHCLGLFLKPLRRLQIQTHWVIIESVIDRVKPGESCWELDAHVFLRSSESEQTSVGENRRKLVMAVMPVLLVYNLVGFHAAVYTTFCGDAGGRVPNITLKLFIHHCSFWCLIYALCKAKRCFLIPH